MSDLQVPKSPILREPQEWNEPNYKSRGQSETSAFVESKHLTLKWLLKYKEGILMLRQYKSELSEYVMVLSIQVGWNNSHESKFFVPQLQSHQPIPFSVLLQASSRAD